MHVGEENCLSIGNEISQLIGNTCLTEPVTGSLQGLASNAACRLDPEPVWSQVIYNEDGTMVQRDPSQGAGGVIELEYDHLICAVGTAARSTIVPGAKEFCFNLKTSQDSKRLRTAIGEALEYASRPDVQEYYYDDDESKMLATAERRRRVTIAVVGGGPTGVSSSDFVLTRIQS
mmetsp:Transcript_19396/g.39634  ORF Transcript_19396/g.39634 Transcript_19396/m.39634 type:complete len:175 (-) Transcript_19396:975-1499(-)